jgi:hypothetical protein
MAKILVSLVSDQTIPNVLLIKEFGEVDKYLFISTAGMEKKGSRHWTVKSANIPTEKILPTIIVNEFDFEDIEKKFSDFDFSDNDEILLNITGGTKIMSIVALDFFKELGAKIFYVTTNKNECIKVFPKSKQKTFTLKSQVSVKEYIEAYGFEIKKQGKITQKAEVTQKVFEYFVPFFEPETTLLSPHIQVFEELQKFRSKKEISVETVNGLGGLLQDLRFETSKTGFVSKDEIVYLSGGWFEEYIYHRIKTEFALNEDFISIGLNVSKREVPNELDVVFLYENKIYMIECKTSVHFIDKDGKKRTTIGDFVYKSDSLQNEFGLYPIAAIATLSALRNREGIISQLAEAHYKRADLYKINILAYSEITSRKSFKEMIKK